MTKRRQFIKDIIFLPVTFPAVNHLLLNNFNNSVNLVQSDFSIKMKPVGRILEEEGYYVWSNSPIYGIDNKVTFFIPAVRKSMEWEVGFINAKLWKI